MSDLDRWLKNERLRLDPDYTPPRTFWDRFWDRAAAFIGSMFAALYLGFVGWILVSLLLFIL